MEKVFFKKGNKYIGPQPFEASQPKILNGSGGSGNFDSYFQC